MAEHGEQSASAESGEIIIRGDGLEPSSRTGVTWGTVPASVFVIFADELVRPDLTIDSGSEPPEDEMDDPKPRQGS